MENFVHLGEKFALEGEKLLEFVHEQEEKEQKRRQLEEKEQKRRQLEEEKEEKPRQLEEEKEEKRRQRKKARSRRERRKTQKRGRRKRNKATRTRIEEIRNGCGQKEAAEAAKREHELELARLGQGNLDDRPRDREDRAKAPKLPSFVDGKDDLDAYLQRFERFAETAKWNKIGWASKLSALLSGRALKVYSRLSEEAAKDYDKVKIALMKRYDLTRRKFRASKPEADESPEQFIVRLDRYLLRWLELSDTDQTFGGLKDLIVREQFIDSCPKDLAIHLRERAPETLAKIAKIADQYLEAHDKHLFSPESQQYSKGGTKPRICRAIKQLSIALSATPEVIKLSTAQS
ncbi:PREDICTED: caldesmon-like [Acropora digitifera]|uniref:caldesmon-like n=1 Tax=Acropora digitifera TaxID=70779 RepID=UPI00077AE2FC|nr:PREDICTED: caldesmon-like [Acropora digitifera]